MKLLIRLKYIYIYIYHIILSLSYFNFQTLIAYNSINNFQITFLYKNIFAYLESIKQILLTLYIYFLFP